MFLKLSKLPLTSAMRTFHLFRTLPLLAKGFLAQLDFKRLGILSWAAPQQTTGDGNLWQVMTSRCGRLEAVTSAGSESISEVFLVPRKMCGNSTWKRNWVLTKLSRRGSKGNQGSKIRSREEGQSRSLMPCTAYTAHCQHWICTLWSGKDQNTKLLL